MAYTVDLTIDEGIDFTEVTQVSDRYQIAITSVNNDLVNVYTYDLNNNSYTEDISINVSDTSDLASPKAITTIGTKVIFTTNGTNKNLNIFDVDNYNTQSDITSYDLPDSTSYSDVVVLDNNTVAVSNYDNNIYVVNIDTGNIKFTIDNHTDGIYRINNFNSKIYAGSFSKEFKVFDYDLNNNSFTETKSKTFNDFVRSNEIFDDNKIALCLDDNGTGDYPIKILNKSDLTEIYEINNEHSSYYQNIYKQSNKLLTASDTVKIFDIGDTNYTLDDTFTDHASTVSDVKVIKDQKIISISDTVKIWDAGLPAEKTLTGIDTNLLANELLIDQETNVEVIANYDDGSTEDVTSDATVTSNDTSVVSVTKPTVTAEGFGSTTVQGDYEGETDTAPISVVQDIVMSTLRVENVTEDDAVLYGEITQRNDSTISALNVGFDYKKTANNTYQSIDAESVNLDNISFPYEYSVFLDNLDSGSNYEFRAFGEEP